MPHDITPSPRDLLLDCDGVLFDWVGGFARYAKKVLEKDLDPAGPSDFNLSSWIGCSEDELHDLVSGFNKGDGGFFGTLNPLPGARETLLAAHAQGRAMTIITACSTDPEVVSQRKKNLNDVFGDIFKDIHIVDFTTSKRDILSQFKNVSWVEDKAENALLGAELGHKSYLIRASHNIKYEGQMAHPLLTWVDGWSCIRRHENIEHRAEDPILSA
jgi:FMN phosphatase YigB (HAD superfamily)